jgi:deoxyguanosine kinase
MIESLAEDERRQKFRDDVPRSAGGLGAVVGIAVGDALAKAVFAVAVDCDEQELAIVDTAEAGLEESDERKAQQPQLEAFDSHPPMLSQGDGAARDGAATEPHRSSCYTRNTLDFRYIAIEGPLGVGKSALADELGARLDATVVLDETDNPFLSDFYSERPGAGFQAQLFFTLARHRQQMTLRQRDLFSQLTICDYLFERDKIYAYLNLDDNELFIYQRLFDLLARDVPPPDLVVYLQAPTEVLIERLRRRPEDDTESDLPRPGEEYIRELNEAYQHFFFHYTATPLLVVETSEFDPETDDDALDELVRQIKGMGKGTRYYIARK